MIASAPAPPLCSPQDCCYVAVCFPCAASATCHAVTVERDDELPRLDPYLCLGAFALSALPCFAGVLALNAQARVAEAYSIDVSHEGDGAGATSSAFLCCVACCPLLACCVPCCVLHRAIETIRIMREAHVSTIFSEDQSSNGGVRFSGCSPRTGTSATVLPFQEYVLKQQPALLADPAAVPPGQVSMAAMPLGIEEGSVGGGRPAPKQYPPVRRSSAAWLAGVFSPSKLLRSPPMSASAEQPGRVTSAAIHTSVSAASTMAEGVDDESAPEPRAAAHGPRAPRPLSALEASMVEAIKDTEAEPIAELVSPPHVLRSSPLAPPPKLPSMLPVMPLREQRRWLTPESAAHSTRDALGRGVRDAGAAEDESELHGLPREPAAPDHSLLRPLPRQVLITAAHPDGGVSSLSDSEAPQLELRIGSSLVMPPIQPRGPVAAIGGRGWLAASPPSARATLLPPPLHCVASREPSVRPPDSSKMRGGAAGALRRGGPPVSGRALSVATSTPSRFAEDQLPADATTYDGELRGVYDGEAAAAAATAALVAAGDSQSLEELPAPCASPSSGGLADGRGGGGRGGDDEISLDALHIALAMGAESDAALPSRTGGRGSPGPGWRAAPGMASQAALPAPVSEPSPRVVSQRAAALSAQPALASRSRSPERSQPQVAWGEPSAPSSVPRRRKPPPPTEERYSSPPSSSAAAQSQTPSQLSPVRGLRGFAQLGAGAGLRTVSAGGGARPGLSVKTRASSGAGSSGEL